MAYELDVRSPRDTGWINLEEPREVRYWTRTFAVTETRLRSAVCAAGDSTQAVCRYLGIPRVSRQAPALQEADQI
ncbi:MULTISPECIES: DUF3606 domain-containing protein [Variovorax]|jgi:hypothetical protein|uniref:DUF3606 domain-containing protein n=1 Tax=Variovorax TaxID=34072 RepID=UPI0015FF9BBB|nr:MULTISPECIES: DUF3606 domain-containing protein [unclassified Variovorax]MBB1603643.1 hypothetical protein [Variovorax sp. UMC13]MDM0089869.1 DUF3606 domain-containing protein [Variovorax sp. J22G40]MDM0148465.1 DUF3606 domain-containing protein [Variovorax sp. J2P1-31]